MRSWSCKLATQHKSPVTAFIFIFVSVFCFYSFFLLLFLLLLFLLFVSIAVVSVSRLLFVCVDSFEFFFLCFQGPFTWLTLGKKKTFNFWIKDGKMFQPLDFCSWARDVTIARLICDKHLMTVNPAHWWIQKKNQIEPPLVILMKIFFFLQMIFPFVSSTTIYAIYAFYKFSSKNTEIVFRSKFLANRT